MEIVHDFLVNGGSSLTAWRNLVALMDTDSSAPLSTAIIAEPAGMAAKYIALDLLVNSELHFEEAASSTDFATLRALQIYAELQRGRRRTEKGDITVTEILAKDPVAARNFSFFANLCVS